MLVIKFIDLLRIKSKPLKNTKQNSPFPTTQTKSNNIRATKYQILTTAEITTQQSKCVLDELSRGQARRGGRHTHTWL